MAAGTEKLSLDEAAELEKLLAEGDSGGTVESAGKPGVIGVFIRRLKTFIKIRKKMALIIGVSFFVVLLLGLFSLYFFSSLSKQRIAEEAKIEDKAPPPEQEPVAEVHTYKLEPFFLPFTEADGDNDEFITVTLHLLLSNAKLENEVNSHLLLIRRSIYNVFKSHKLDEYRTMRPQIEEHLKQEILTAINPLLLRGTGTITDVFYSDFLLKT
jgi:flagellar basal body-associated protein FliL